MKDNTVCREMFWITFCCPMCPSNKKNGNGVLRRIRTRRDERRHRLVLIPASPQSGLIADLEGKFVHWVINMESITIMVL